MDLSLKMGIASNLLQKCQLLPVLARVLLKAPLLVVLAVIPAIFLARRARHPLPTNA